MQSLLVLDIASFPLANQITVILINAVGLFLITAVVKRNTLKDKLTSVFLVMGILMFLWIDFAYLARLVGTTNLYWGEQFLRIAWVATPLFFAYVYLITVFMLHKERSRTYVRHLIILSALGLSALTAFTNIIIKGISFSGNDLDIEYGSGFYPFLVVITIYIVATLVPIFTTKLEDYRKRRVRIFLTGVIIFYVANLIFNIALPAFFGVTHLYYFGDYSLVFLLGFTAYAILRYRLLDIKTVIFRAVGLVALSSLFFVLYGSAIYFVIRYAKQFELSALELTLLNIVLVMIAIPSSQYFFGFLRKVTDKFLFQSRIDYQRAIVEVSEELSSTIDITNVTDTLLDTTREILRASKTIILLKNPDTETFEVSGEENAKGFQAVIQSDNPLIQYLKNNQSVIFKDNLRVEQEDSSDEQKEKLEVVDESLRWLDASILVPLFVNKKLTGLLVLGQKLSGEQYSGDEINFLSTFSPQAAVALENARLYKESLEFGARLEKEVEEATEELAHANEELRNLDKAKSEFLSIASHQLYTPLTALRGYLSMLQENEYGNLPEKQSPVIEILEKSTTRLIDLVKNLLDISRIESGRLELNLTSVDLADMANVLVKDLLPNAIKRDLNLQFIKPESAPPNVIADADRLRQVLLNLVDNAIKYTDTGSIDVKVYQDDDDIIFSVSDTGKGMTADEIKKLFNKFTRVGGAARFHTEGAGLGLYVARQIVKEHHGDVSADSSGLNQGSTFTVRLPTEGSPRSLRIGDKASVVIKAAEATGAINNADDEPK